MRVTLALVVLLLAAGIRGAAADAETWRAAGWKTDFETATVDLREFLSGGPPRDGIPSIDDPVFKPASEISGIGPREPVIRFAVGDQVRAYPLRVLMWHEIVNDRVGDLPVVVTYCPLCNSAIVFDARVDGRALEFGVSGLLRNSDMVMYDRETESWWQQFTGEGVVGTHAGRELKMLASRVESFEDFASTNPGGEVLVPNSPAIRNYGRNPYIQYDSRRAPYPLYRGDLPAEIDPMARVIVVRYGGNVRAVTLAHLRAEGDVAMGEIALSWRAGVNSALDTAHIASGQDVGAVEVSVAASGEPVVHDITFAFVVNAFHPGIEVLTETGAVTLSAR